MRKTRTYIVPPRFPISLQRMIAGKRSEAWRMLCTQLQIKRWKLERWMSGDRKMTEEEVIMFARFFGITPDEARAAVEAAVLHRKELRLLGVSEVSDAPLRIGALLERPQLEIRRIET